jgi:hypothetical protein
MSRSATVARQERIRSPAIDASSRTVDQSVVLPIPAAPSMSTRAGRSPRSAARMDSRSASRPTIGVPVMVRPYSRMKAVPDDSPAGGSSSARRPYHAVRFDRRCESAAGWSWAAVALFEGAYAVYLGSGGVGQWGHSDDLAGASRKTRGPGSQSSRTPTSAGKPLDAGSLRRRGELRPDLEPSLALDLLFGLHRSETYLARQGPLARPQRP